MNRSIEDFVSYTISDAGSLAEHHIYDKKNGRHPKRMFWSVIEKNIKDFLTADRKTRILLLPGLRGTGKTVALLQLWDQLVNEQGFPQEQVLYFSMDRVKQAVNCSLYDFITAFIEKVHGQNLSGIRKELFILADECHFDRQWDESLKVICDAAPKKVFIVATGSSAISIQTSPDLARRSSKETVFPLNFSEYMIMKKNFYPEKGTASSVRNAVRNPSPENIKELNLKESANRLKLLNKGIEFNRSFREFIFCGGFANGISMDRFELYLKINEMVDKTIAKDLVFTRNFTLLSQNDIRRIINFLPFQTSGTFSREGMSSDLGITATKVDQILKALEESHLIFSLKPKSTGKSITRKPWKYYFMSPTLNAAVYSRSKPVDVWNDHLYGPLVENLAAFYLLKMTWPGQGAEFFYDSKEKSADFIVGDREPVPVEIGIGRKNDSQVKNSVRTHRSGHGVLVHNCEKTEMRGRVLHVPLSTFAFL